MKKELQKYELIERSILTEYRRDLWAPFIRAVKDYELIKENDKIAVCISGGKDSMLCAKLMQMLQRISDFPFELVYLVMDPGYKKENREKIIKNAEMLNIPIEIFDSNIFEVVDSVEKSPCYLCARMRRGHLYANAKEKGCNKIALGHHMSDVIETTLMGMLYGAQIQAMLPRLKSTNFEGMELIRPMYCINEEAVLTWRDKHGLDFIRCACRVTKLNEDHATASIRAQTKALIKELKKTNPMIEKNIFKSIHNVQLDTLVSYKKDNEVHSFLENL